MSESRRSFFRNASILGAGLMSWTESMRAQKSPPHHSQGAHVPRGRISPNAGAPAVRMQSPDILDLPFTLDGETKVFRLIAQPLKRQIVPWKTLHVWGYSGSSPGPTIQVNQGDRVRIFVENRLPESTSMHWHGIEVPINQDGVPWVSQRPIAPGETFAYEFTVRQEGTFFYHAHSAMQEMIGLIGMFMFGAGQDTSAKLLGNSMKYLVERPELQDQLRADPKQIPLLCMQTNQKPVILIESASLIQQKPHRAVVVGDHHVDGSVIIDITKGSATAHLGQGKSGACGGCNIAELLSIAVVVKQQIGLPKRIRGPSQRLDPVYRAICNEEV